MHIIGPFRIAPGAQPATTNRVANPQQPSTSRTAQPVDQLDLSSAATGVSGASPTSEASGDAIRVDKVAAIRRAIADGTYETPDKLDRALDRMLDEFA